MKRRARFAALALLASFVLSTTACTDLTGPRGVDADQPDAELNGSFT